MSVLDVQDLRTTFLTDDGPVRAVDGVSFALERGKVLGIVGESGSGKSVTALTIMGLLPKRGIAVQGMALLNGRDLLTSSEKELRRIRGNNIAMIFQDPMTSLNPVYTVGWQLKEALQLHGDFSRRRARQRARELLLAVGIPDPSSRLDDYPHQFSGGMRQRVMVAIALANDPDVLIADEPTTALDVTTQAQILALVGRMCADAGSAMLMITHDLGVVAQVCDDVAVMYSGRLVELGTADRIFEEPQHPYTWGLLGSLPSRVASGRLVAIPGSPPSMLRPPPGCRFAPRCQHAMETCRQEPGPALKQMSDTSGRHLDACLLPVAAKHAAARRLLAAPAQEATP